MGWPTGKFAVFSNVAKASKASGGNVSPTLPTPIAKGITASAFNINSSHIGQGLIDTDPDNTQSNQPNGVPIFLNRRMGLYFQIIVATDNAVDGLIVKLQTSDDASAAGTATGWTDLQNFGGIETTASGATIEKQLEDSMLVKRYLRLHLTPTNSSFVPLSSGTANSTGSIIAFLEANPARQPVKGGYSFAVGQSDKI